MRDRSANVRAEVAAIAANQWGTVRRDQLTSAGIDRSKITRWIHEGYLHPIHPGVYAVGHTATGIEAELVSALFYAGPGAMLSHYTATWWWGLSDREPSRIEVSTPRRRRSLPRRGRRAVRVHARRTLDRVWHNRLPVTTVEQTPAASAGQTPARAGFYAVGVRAADARAMRVGRTADPGGECGGGRYDGGRPVAGPARDR